MGLINRLQENGIKLFDETSSSLFLDVVQKIFNKFSDSACMDFNPQEIKDKFRSLVASNENFQELDWGSCYTATYQSSEILSDLLSAYSPTYCAIYTLGNVNGGPSGHIWLETEVCGETYITDLVGGGFFSQQFGFGAHYFDHKPATPLQPGYYEFTPTTAHCSHSRLDSTSDTSYEAYDYSQEKLDDEREKAGTLTLWEEFVRWLKK